MWASQEVRAWARKQRENPTYAEAVLWWSLSDKQLGTKFRRKHVLFGWVVDFYCHEYRLVVDVLEGHEGANWASDAALRDRGYCILRLIESEVLRDLDHALDRIRNAMLALGG